jgi:hypothetical protein
MNVVFRHTFRAANGWRWQIQIHTADPAPLVSPMVITLPENCIINEGLEWACKFSDLPIGLTDTPTLKVSFNVASLVGTPALDHLRLRLQRPFVVEVVPDVIIPATTEEQQRWEIEPYDGSGYWRNYTVPVPAYSLSPDIKDFKLTNHILLTSDEGNSALPEANFAYMFSGCQRPSPSAKLTGLRNPNFSTITIEFFHSARFVLEQISADMLSAYIRKRPSVQRNYAANVSFLDVPKKAQFIEQPKDVTETSAAMSFWKVSDFFAAINEIAEEIGKKVYRRTADVAIIPTGGYGFVRFHYAGISDFDQSILIFGNDIYFLGSVSNPPDWKKQGGLLDKGSPLYGEETVFDVLKLIYEAGSLVTYTEINTGFIASKMRGTDSGVTLTTDDVQIDEADNGATTIRGVELNMQGISNIRYTNTGASFADKDWTLKLFWHNATPEIDGEKKETDSADQVISQKYNTTKLYTIASADYMLAVHPSCGLDSGATIVNTPSISKTAPNDLTGILRRDWKWGKPEYDYIVRQWTETTGYHTLVAQEILAIFGNYEQMKFPAKTAKNSVLANVLPIDVGKVFTLAAGLFPPIYQQPNKAYLIGSIVKLYDGTAELEFFAPKAGVL